MRVKVMLWSLLAVLLALCLLAPQAAAMYVPGQPTPNDGLMHIMSDDTGQATSAGMPADDSLSMANVLPAGLLDDAYSTQDGLPAGFPSMLTASIMPAMMPYGEFATMPLTSDMPMEMASTGNVRGTTVSPVKTDLWNLASLGDLQTNMPVLCIPFS